MSIRSSACSGLFCAVWSVSAVQAATVRVASPSGAAVIEVQTSPRLTYTVKFQNQVIIRPSPLAWSLEGVGEVGAGLSVKAQKQTRINEVWDAIAGKRSHVENRANEVKLTLADKAAHTFELHLRAYDDGVAFRYGVPSQPGLETFRLQHEATQIAFPAASHAWAANYETFTSPQEHEFRHTRTNEVPREALFGLPFLVQAHAKAWVAVTESDLLDWAGFYLRPTDRDDTFVTALSPLPSSPSIAVQGKQQRLSPWRVFLLGETPGALVQSDVVRNLATPNQLADTSWIHPGRAAWDRWWPGDYNPGAKNKQGMNTATMKDFVDLAHEMGWEYQIVDWTWYGKPENPNASLTNITRDLDLPSLVSYARERNVGIWMWARWNHMNKQMEEALPLFHKWGVVGIKVDFMDRDDQEMVNFYERLVKLAAQNHLMVDLHGAFKPTGLERTYPNLLTREGVMGNEYNKWSTRITPAHKVTLAFTRMLAGPMDFTPGGFRNVAPGSFAMKDTAPQVQGTRASELALPVIYESGLQVFCDAPGEYRAAKGQGLEFYKQVPAAWDETRVLAGAPDEYIAVARRKGNRWFLGAITTTERRLELPLQFLGKGSFKVNTWFDAPDSAAKPTHVIEGQANVAAQGTFVFTMAPGGGAAAIFTAAP
ncbi:MAG: glycoside hydrolase family 97 protein [Deltaproteobacteria bacterium]|nr:glycoside hydrolase family 97 protein [Deltaproteobacteria bacterium]